MLRYFPRGLLLILPCVLIAFITLAAWFLRRTLIVRVLHVKNEWLAWLLAVAVVLALLGCVAWMSGIRFTRIVGK